VFQGRCHDPSEQDMEFGNLIPLPITNEIVPARPSYYYGENLQSIHPSIFEMLCGSIVPTVKWDLILPNFFLQLFCEAPRMLAEDKALYSGIQGAHAIHALREYIDSDTSYDGNAYTITAILDDMCLGLYAVHLTQPSHDRDLPEYHLNCLKFWVISESLETFREAVNAYRNARDFTRRVRRELINKANSKAGWPNLVFAENHMHAPIDDPLDS
jgi:hypothetical protein